MLEAVLFGYEKGAFTGAYQRTAGKFELAQGGTLLLDEISEMDLGLQAKLLRVLQEREVERLGGHKLIELDVRVLATTNRDLRDMVSKNKFREDLFYRLNVFPLTMPPLRARTQDIVALAEAFISKHSKANNAIDPFLTAQASEKLAQHPWPGNVRELENVIQRALVICRGQQIEADDLIMETDISGGDQKMDIHVIEGKNVLNSDLKKHEQELILHALRIGNGSRKLAAKALGISPRTLRYKISRMRDQGIVIPRSYGALSI
jgi:two-component system response regulator FlrC